LAFVGHSGQHKRQGQALAFVLARVAYIVCYVTDRASLRSLVWLVGFAVSVSLFVLAARAV